MCIHIIIFYRNSVCLKQETSIFKFTFLNNYGKLKLIFEKWQLSKSIIISYNKKYTS